MDNRLERTLLEILEDIRLLVLTPMTYFFKSEDKERLGKELHYHGW